MANTTPSPNMNMPVPVVSTDPGPDWATNINSCLSILDSHTHISGQGVPITPDGLNINADLPLNDNNVTTGRSVRFSPQAAVLSNPADLGCLYEVSEDLYYNDGAGNQIRLTQSGSIVGAAGTITGLPSGTASASFGASAYTFQSATSTPASLNVGPITISQAVASGKGVTISASGSQAANYALTLPIALPVAPSVVSLDAAGNLSSISTTGSGNAVLATAPTFVGIPLGTITSSTFSPTVTQVHISGGTITFTTSISTWNYIRIGNIVTVSGQVTYNLTAYSGTPAQYNWQATIPIPTSSLVIAGGHTINVAANTTDVLTDLSTTSVIQSSVSGSTYNGNASGRLIAFNYSYQII